MTAPTRGARRGWLALAVVAVVAAAAACTTTNAPVTGTQSLAVELVLPTDPGTVDTRLPSTVRSLTVSVTALGPDGQIDTSFDRDVQVYAQYLGTLTPYLGGTPLARWHLTAGTITNQTVMLPQVYGPTALWVDDGADSKPIYATGVSPVLWFRDPFIADIRTPADENRFPDAFQKTQLDGKNVRIAHSRWGAVGRLVVTSVFAQGYTVADVQCQDAAGTPPCTSQPYDNIDVFSFHAPTDQHLVQGGAQGTRRFVFEGEQIDAIAGGVTEFDGLCEIGFPQTFVNAPQCNGPADCTAPLVCSHHACVDQAGADKTREPPPIKFDTCPSGQACDATHLDCCWFKKPINFKYAESAMIEIDNAVVCNLGPDYLSFNQWKIDPSGVGGDCTTGSNYISVISAGVVPTDPATLVGKTLRSVVGNLRSINIDNFHVWIIYPRGPADLVP